MTDKSAMMEKLDAHHLLLDGSAAPGTAWCFRSLQELFASGALQDGTPEAPDDGISGAGCLLAA